VVLRYRRPDLPRTFRTPGMPVVPVVGMPFSVWLITSPRPATWLRFVVWLGLGMIIYFAYGRRRSLLPRQPAAA
jgi:APA family basic amino acid/polyamine antiporter